MERIRVEQNSGNIGLRHLDGLKLEKQKFGTVLIPNVWGFIEIRIKHKFDDDLYLNFKYNIDPNLTGGPVRNFSLSSFFTMI